MIILVVIGILEIGNYGNSCIALLNQAAGVKKGELEFVTFAFSTQRQTGGGGYS